MDDPHVYDPLPGGNVCGYCDKPKPACIGVVRKYDPVERPKHYNVHPSGVECIQITEHMNFCLGNAVKYLWRAGEKGDAVEDLRKAAWYINREIERLTKETT